MAERQQDEPQVLPPHTVAPIERTGIGYLLLFLINLITVALTLGGAWYFWGNNYITTLESRLFSVVEAEKSTANLSDIKGMWDHFHDISGKVESLTNKVLNLEQRNADLQQHIQTLEANLNNAKATNASLNVTTKDTWQDHLINTIKLGLPLTPFRQDQAIPESIREMMVGLDFIPTYKNISKDWNRIRHNLQFQFNVGDLDSAKAETWWGKFKVFLKGVFRIQRLNADNLTPEEIFVYHADKLLLEKDIDALIQWVNQHEKQFDSVAKNKVVLWVQKLSTFQKGQQIIAMMRTYK